MLPTKLFITNKLWTSYWRLSYTTTLTKTNTIGAVTGGSLTTLKETQRAMDPYPASLVTYYTLLGRAPESKRLACSLSGRNYGMRKRDTSDLMSYDWMIPGNPTTARRTRTIPNMESEEAVIIIIIRKGISTWRNDAFPLVLKNLPAVRRDKPLSRRERPQLAYLKQQQ